MKMWPIKSDFIRTYPNLSELIRVKRFKTKSLLHRTRIKSDINFPFSQSNRETNFQLKIFPDVMIYIHPKHYHDFQGGNHDAANNR